MNDNWGLTFSLVLFSMFLLAVALGLAVMGNSITSRTGDKMIKY